MKAKPHWGMQDYMSCTVTSHQPSRARSLGYSMHLQITAISRYLGVLLLDTQEVSKRINLKFQLFSDLMWLVIELS